MEVDIETSSSESSSNHSNDDAESEHTALESEALSLPEDLTENAAAQTVVQQQVSPSTESQTNRAENESREEFHDSKEENGQPSTSKET